MSRKSFWCCLVLLVFATSLNGQSLTPLAITIDDLPGFRGDNTLEVNQKIIEALQANDWPAVGFVNEGIFYEDGQLDSATLEVLHLWLGKGFELGNHTYSHMNYHRVDTSAYFDNIVCGEILTRPLSESYGLPFRYFRHPYLRNGKTADQKRALNRFLERNDYQVAPVTIDNAEWIYAQAYRKAKRNGDLVMTDSIRQSYITYMVAMSNYYREQARRLVGRDIPHVLLIHVRELNADLLEELVKALEKERFEVKPLAVVLSDPVYQLEDGYYGDAGISWVERWAMARSLPDDFYLGIPRCPRFVQEYAGLNE